VKISEDICVVSVLKLTTNGTNGFIHDTRDVVNYRFYISKQMVVNINLYNVMMVGDV
jgi:hypothetical protein